METAIKLNDKQLALLRWVADGCPEGVMPDETHRISAAALRNRGLATTSGRGPRWKATLTDAGRDYLAQLDEGELGLLDGLGASGGLGALDGLGVLNELGALGAMDLPERHPVARDFHDRIERHEVSRLQLGRATAMVQALAVAAEERGWRVTTAGESGNEVGLVDWASAKDGHFVIDAGTSTYWLRLQEEGVRTRVALADDDSLDAFDADGTGRLKLELRWGEWFTRKQTRWIDHGDAPLEQRLTEVLREIEERAADAARIERERREHDATAAAAAAAEAEARSAERARLMDLARERFLADRQRSELLEQVERFEQAARIRAYCDAVIASGRASDAAVAGWVRWAREYADQLDPLAGDGHGPRAPEELEPAPAELQAYLPDGRGASGLSVAARPAA